MAGPCCSPKVKLGGSHRPTWVSVNKAVWAVVFIKVLGGMAAGLPRRYLVVLRQLVYGWAGVICQYGHVVAIIFLTSPVCGRWEGCISCNMNKRRYLWIRLSHWKFASLFLFKKKRKEILL